MMRTNSVAVKMADKHELVPTALKPPKEFRETVKIGSASSWDKITLQLFHVAFDRNRFSSLRDFIDSTYFQSPTDDQDYRHRNTYIIITHDRLRVYFACLRRCR